MNVVSNNNKSKKKKLALISNAVLLGAVSLLSACSTANDSATVIDTVLADKARGDSAARDQYRHPKQTLEFFGLTPETSVVEIWPGGGWYTKVINPLVKGNGKYYAAHFPTFEGGSKFYQRSFDSFKEKVATDPLYQGAEITQFHPTKLLDFAPENSVDMVLTFRNVHNWYIGGEDAAVESAFAGFYKALKKGGVLGVVEHRMPENLDQVANKRSGYMKQSYVIAAAEKAGFKLVATSEINANAKDTAQHPKGVWTLPPSLRLGDEDKAKYLEIGESDRMTLKFVK
jgi:predicted methyltransferase